MPFSFFSSLFLFLLRVSFHIISLFFLLLIFAFNVSLLPRGAYDHFLLKWVTRVNVRVEEHAGSYTCFEALMDWGILCWQIRVGTVLVIIAPISHTRLLRVQSLRCSRCIRAV